MNFSIFQRRAIEIRKNLGTEQNKTMELLTQRLHWHGKTAISMFTKNKFLRQLNSVTVSRLFHWRTLNLSYLECGVIEIDNVCSITGIGVAGRIAENLLIK